jgi:hypothetical protein
VEESAVRHSGAPDLPVYNYLPFVILSEAPHKRIAQDDELVGILKGKIP